MSGMSGGMTGGMGGFSGGPGMGTFGRSFDAPMSPMGGGMGQIGRPQMFGGVSPQFAGGGMMHPALAAMSAHLMGMPPGGMPQLMQQHMMAQQLMGRPQAFGAPQMAPQMHGMMPGAMGPGVANFMQHFQQMPAPGQNPYAQRLSGFLGMPQQNMNPMAGRLGSNFGPPRSIFG